MKRNLFGLFMLLILAVFAQAQTGTPYDCQLTATFTASNLTSASYYNRGPAAPCIAWRLTYSTINATAVSISLQGTTNLANGTADPAGWTNLTTPTGSSNPATGTNSGTIASCCDYYPWIRAIAGTFTGTNQTMSLSVLGYKGTSASRNTGGGGTVTAVTGVSPIISNNSSTTPAISLDKTLVAQKFFVTAPPTNITGNLPGDLATDTTNHKEYVCNAPAGTAPPACTAVAAAGWLLLNSSGGGTVTTFGLFSALPGIGTTTGDTYVLTDGSYLPSFRYLTWDGLAWERMRVWQDSYARSLLGNPVLTTGWSLLNSPPVVFAYGDSILTLADTFPSDQLRIYAQSVPVAPYTITSVQLGNTVGGNTQELGLYLKNSGAAAITGITFIAQTGYRGIEVRRWTNYTTYGSSPATANVTSLTSNTQQAVWLQITDDGINRIWSYSLDGSTPYTVLLSELNNAYLVPDQIGPGGDNNISPGSPNYQINQIQWLVQ